MEVKGREREEKRRGWGREGRGTERRGGGQSPLNISASNSPCAYGLITQSIDAHVYAIYVL